MKINLPNKLTGFSFLLVLITPTLIWIDINTNWSLECMMNYQDCKNKKIGGDVHDNCDDNADYIMKQKSVR